MPYSEELAARVRAVMPAADVQERKMFGGLAFMVRGHMSCGILDERLMVRVAPAAYDAALAEPHVKPMDFTGKPMRGFVYVEPAGIATEEDLAQWVGRGVAFAHSLPPK